MERVLGIHCGHDASAALVIDGKVVACASEERFVRIKHYSGRPVNAIGYCLEAAGLSIDDIDEVAGNRIMVDRAAMHLLLNLDVDVPTRAAVEKSWVVEAPPLYVPKWQAKRRIPTRFIDHHMAHAASAFYTSGLREPTLVFTADGEGDDTSLAVWRVSLPASFERMYHEGRNGSLGWFYGLMTEALGWWVSDGEGKTMGLAPYGTTAGLEGILDDFCPRYESGRLTRPHDFGHLGVWQEAGTTHFHMAELDAVMRVMAGHRREDIAAEAQRVLEREMVALVRHWLERHGARAACFAGGLMLNVKLNQRIWETGLLDIQHVFPEAGDGGLAIGAALLGSAARGGPIPAGPIRDLHWGPEYDGRTIKGLLDERHIAYTHTNDPARAAAERLAVGKILGWFQGRMECGPRALGNRSILMDPRRAENKDVINARVKFREAFRPFCPSMTERAARELLDVRARTERFMTTSFDVRPEVRDRIAAVVHADGTARPQIVEESVNPLFHRLLQQFGALTGVECLLNTSFNIRGEPIVCHPREAIRGFFDTGMDSLILGEFILDK